MVLFNSTTKIMAMCLFLILFISPANFCWSQNIKEIDVVTWAVSERPMDPIESIPFSLRNTSSDGSVKVSHDQIMYFRNRILIKSIPLQPEDDRVRYTVTSRNGMFVVYVVEKKEDRHNILYIRRRFSNMLEFSTPEELYRTEYAPPFEFMQVMGISDDGETVLWRENSVKGERVMAIKNISSPNRKIAELHLGRHISYEVFLSGNGEWAFFYAWKTEDKNGNRVERSTFFMQYKDGNWTPAEVLTIDGEPNHEVVRDVNEDASFVLIGNKVITKELGSYKLSWKFEPPNNTIENAQMSEDGETVAFISYEQKTGQDFIRSGLEEVKPVPQNLILVQKTGRDGSGNQQVRFIDQAKENITFRLSKEGEKVTWTSSP